MRTLSTNLQNRIADDVTRPGLLVEIGFSNPLKLSSRSTLAWSGSTWTAWDIDARGMQVDASSGSLNGGIKLGNTDLVVSTLVMAEGIADRPIIIRVFYGDAPAEDEALAMYSGVCARSQLQYQSASVDIAVDQGGGRTNYAPREYMTKYRGFNLLPADGTLIPWDGEMFELVGEK
jgi:hypothetical protein